MFDLAIKGSKILTGNGIKNCTVLIKDGVIDDIVSALPEDVEGRVVDIKDNLLMPGIIDPHVHINEPGRTDWEGFNTATRAAVSGGVTTVVDMPLNSSPVTTTVDAFEKKLSAANNQLHCNCGFWGGIIPGNENEIDGLIKKGVLGFKAFLTHSGIDEFPNVTENELRTVMPVIARHDLPLLVHCELTTSVKLETSIPDASYQNYLQSRPKEWEDKAIALMIRLCEEYVCRVHIVHVSSADSIELIKTAKKKGLPLTAETAQHYLYFHAEDIEDGKTQFKCAPPIREKENNERLWQALKQGIIDFVASDHSPSPPELKQLETGDFMKAWGGISSLQFALPALWTAARKRNADVNDIAMWLCEKPARLTGKHNSKGKIARGYDADLVVWDPEKKFTVTDQIIHHRHKLTPYMNEVLYGVVEQTFIRGMKVYDRGVFTLSDQGKIIMR